MKACSGACHHNTRMLQGAAGPKHQSRFISNFHASFKVVHVKISFIG